MAMEGKTSGKFAQHPRKSAHFCKKPIERITYVKRKLVRQDFTKTMYTLDA